MEVGCKKKNIIYKLCLLIMCTSVWCIVLWNTFHETMWQSNLLWIIILAIACITWRKDAYVNILKNHRISIIIFDLLLSFCLIGNYLFCYPLDKNVSIVSVLEYVIFAVTGTPLVLMISSGSECVKRFLCHFLNKEVGRYRLHFLCYLLIPIIVGIISMLALNPCVVSYDAYEVIAEAKGLTSIQDYAGVPYVLWFRLWLSIYDSVEILCFIQIILYALVFGIFFLYLEKRFQVNHRFLFVIYLLFSLLPNNVMMLITLSI